MSSRAGVPVISALTAVVLVLTTGGCDGGSDTVADAPSTSAASSAPASAPVVPSASASKNLSPGTLASPVPLGGTVQFTARTLAVTITSALSADPGAKPNDKAPPPGYQAHSFSVYYRNTGSAPVQPADLRFEVYRDGALTNEPRTLTCTPSKGDNGEAFLKPLPPGQSFTIGQCFYLRPPATGYVLEYLYDPSRANPPAAAAESHFLALSR